MSRVITFHEYGSADVLRIEQASAVDLKENEIRIKVDAIGLNRAEIAFREGKYIERPKQLPSGLGYEASGTVLELGAKSRKFNVGDKVSTIPAFSMADYGVYGEMVVVPEHAVALYPESLSGVEAASIWMQYITAYGALIEYSKIKKNDYVLIPAASSSVGLAAIQLCNLSGAIPIATTRKSDKKQSLIDSGASEVIVTDEQDLVEEVMKFTNGHGIDVAFDPVAGTTVNKLAEAAARNGTIYLYGALASEPTPFPLFPALKKGLRIQGYTIFEITGDDNKRQKAIDFIFKAIESGKLKPKIDRIFKFDDIQDAHRYMESNVQNGKIVVSVD